MRGMKNKIKSNHEKFKKNSKKSLYSQFPKENKKKSELEKQTYLEALSTHLNLPSDILAGAPILTVTGSHQICVENYKGIIEYTGNCIRIQAKSCRIHITGKHLNIDYFTDDEMRISGSITDIVYC